MPGEITNSEDRESQGIEPRNIWNGLILSSEGWKFQVETCSMVEIYGRYCIDDTDCMDRMSFR